MTVDDLYTPLDCAVDVLRKRRADSALCMLIDEYHAPYPPLFMDGGPFACLARAIITPDNELERFASLVSSIGIPPLGLSLCHDMFRGINEDKITYCKLRFWHTHQERVINVVGNYNDGVPFDQIVCRNGVTLPKFHADLLDLSPHQKTICVRDFSAWASSIDPSHLDYQRFLSLFVVHGIDLPPVFRPRGLSVLPCLL